MNLYSKEEVEKVRKAGQVVKKALTKVIEVFESAKTTADLDRTISSIFAENNAQPLFKGYKITPDQPEFPAVSCISINDEVAHGIPGDRVLLPGDLVKVDTACSLDGYCADAAVTILKSSPFHEESTYKAKLKTMNVCRDMLLIAVEELGKSMYWTWTANKMQKYCENFGCFIVKELGGHGIGKELHEEPRTVHNYVDKYARKHDFEVIPGMILAIEPIIQMGRHGVILDDNGWTIKTVGGYPAAHFELTMAVTQQGVEILT